MIDADKTLRTAQKKFIEYLKKQGKASATIVAYGKDIDQFSEYLGKKQISRVTSVLSEHIENFKDYLAENKYTPKSISRKLNSIKTFFRFLKSEDLIEEDPAASIPHPRYEITPPRILSKMEYRALRDSVRDDPRAAAIVELLLQTGMRIGELARLELKDITDKEIRIRAYESHPERIIPLNSPAKKAKDRWLNFRPKTKSNALLVTRTGKPLMIRNIRSALNRFFHLAGIEKATINSLRHTFIAHQLMAGAPVDLIQKIVGHKRLSTTEKYLELVKENVSQIPKIEEL